ncbi:MAG: hypothetical protein FWD80_01470 [Propionibacteriaceae bacterium]|nr:hypothetical protein [Propionibacteriaceae bacterium]
MTNVDAPQVLYRSLVVTTCEWRAFGLEDPQVLADRVFARLGDYRGPQYLKRLYKAVNEVVAAAYRDEAAKNPLWEHFAGLRSGPVNPMKSDEDRIRAVFISLPGRDVVVLRQAYWDELTADEMADVNGGAPAVQTAKVGAALAKFKAKLPNTVTSDPVAALRSIKPGTHWRSML